MRHFLVLSLLMVLAACAPQQQRFRGLDAHNNIVITPNTLLASDETVLPVRSWLPTDKPHAVIVALHGFNDYSHGFESTGDFFRQRGVAVYAYDQRGFGETAYTGVWGGEANMVDDLKQCVRQVQRRYPGVPVYVLGESMGGAVAVVALADPSFPHVSGLILESPAVWGSQAMSMVYRDTLWAAAHVVPQYTLTGNNLHILASNNMMMLWHMSRDPLVIKETRIDTIYGLVQLMGDAYDKIPEVKAPLLLLYGGQDQVIPKMPINGALARFSQPITLVYYPDGFHLLLRDIQGKRVMKDIDSWIDHPGRPVPSGYGRLHKPGDSGIAKSS